MADVITSIGTTARDYSTVTAWHADDGNATASDVAIGEMYDDSAFDEDTNFTSTVPTTWKLRAATSEEHDGTPGTGVRYVHSVSHSDTIRNIDASKMDVDRVEFDGNGQNSARALYMDIGSNNICNIRRCMIHGYYSSTDNVYGIRNENAGIKLSNTMIWDIVQNNSSANGHIAAAIQTQLSTRTDEYKNVTAWDIGADNSNADQYGIRFVNNAAKVFTNVICLGTYNVGSGGSQDFQLISPSNATVSYSMSSDTSASGTGSLVSKAAGDQFVSVAGSIDLHLKAGADAIGAGTDLGTTPDDVEFDIDGYDRDTAGVTWDIGADQYVSAGGGATVGFELAPASLSATSDPKIHSLAP